MSHKRGMRSLLGLSRRQLLQLGAGTAGVLGLPLLRPEQAAASSGKTQRLVIVFTPNGTVPEAFWPTAGAQETGFTLGPIAQPLEAFSQAIVVRQGLVIGGCRGGSRRAASEGGRRLTDQRDVADWRVRGWGWLEIRLGRRYQRRSRDRPIRWA